MQLYNPHCHPKACQHLQNTYKAQATQTLVLFLTSSTCTTHRDNWLSEVWSWGSGSSGQGGYHTMLWASTVGDVILDNSQELHVPLCPSSPFWDCWRCRAPMRNLRSWVYVAHVFLAVTSTCRLRGSGAGSRFGSMCDCAQDAPRGAVCWHRAGCSICLHHTLGLVLIYPDISRWRIRLWVWEAVYQPSWPCFAGREHYGKSKLSFTSQVFWSCDCSSGWMVHGGSKLPFCTVQANLASSSPNNYGVFWMYWECLHFRIIFLQTSTCVPLPGGSRAERQFHVPVGTHRRGGLAFSSVHPFWREKTCGCVSTAD